MEKLLRPDRFEGGPDTTPAQWDHWYRTFTNFLDVIHSEPPPDKLKLLINYVSPKVYAHIADCCTYDEAIKILQTIYVKPANEIFARHKLATRKQLPNESIDDFLQALKLLCRDCAFKAVSAEMYAQEAVRDAFITGLSSTLIR